MNIYPQGYAAHYYAWQIRRCLEQGAPLEETSAMLQQLALALGGSSSVLHQMKPELTPLYLLSLVLTQP